MIKNKLLLKTINKLVDSSFKDGKMIESRVIKSIRTLKTLPIADSIRALLEYLKGLKRTQRQHTLYVETVFKPSPSQIKRIKKIIERKSLPAGRQVKITKTLVSINPEILGGFKITVGDEVWDQSILDKLNQVKEAISGGSNQSN